SAGIIFLGFNLTFFPQFIVGYLGMPRRYHAYPPEFQVLNVLSSAGASILGVGYLIPMLYLMWSLRYGKIAGSNPFGAAGLEWTTTSPPPTSNFSRPPVVTEDAYSYPVQADAHFARRSQPSLGARTPVRQPGTAAGSLDARHVGLSRNRGAVLRRLVCYLLSLPKLVSGGFRGGEPRVVRMGWNPPHRGVNYNTLDDGVGGPPGPG